MPDISKSLGPIAYGPVTGVDCPNCGATPVREQRRLVDRLHSLIVPVKRYRCENFACQWVGNIADTDARAPGSRADPGTGVRGDENQRYSSVPVSFVVHMVLVAAAVVFVMVYSSVESMSWLGERLQSIASSL